GIFSFGYLLQNKDKVKAIPINGVYPSVETIRSGQYPLVRPLYMYVKKNSRKRAEIRNFIDFFLTSSFLGERGLLVQKGLVPLPEKDFNRISKEALEKLGR